MDSLQVSFFQVIARFSLANTQQNLTNFILSFQPSVTFSSPPRMFIGIYHIQWHDNLDIDIRIQNIMENYANATIQINSEILHLTISYVLYDSSLFTLQSQTYFLNATQTETIFSLTNHKNYQIILLNSLLYAIQHYQGQTQLGIQHDRYFSRDSHSLSIILSENIRIQRIRLEMYRIVSAKMYQSHLRFGVALTIATNSNSTLWDNIQHFQADYEDFYFVGLQIPFNLGYSPSYVFDISNRIEIGMQAYMSQIIDLKRFCPIQYPYFNITNLQCLQSCPVSYYATIYQLCEPCDADCYKCLNSSTNCSQCINNLLLTPQSNISNTYICGCENRQYESFDPIHQCIDFPQNCQICQSTGICLQCYPSFYYDPSVNKCFCRGTIVTFRNTPRCIMNKVKENCQNGGRLLSLSDYSCRCHFQIIGICI